MDNEIKKLLKDNQLKIPSKDFTAQTMQKIHEMNEERQAKWKIRPWFIVSPLAAAAVLALFLIFFWPGGKQGTISWADVQKQLAQVHTMTARYSAELITSSSNLLWNSMKVYIKDPGLYRLEIYDTDNEFIPQNKPQWIAILKSDPGLRKGLTLHPDSQWAEMWSEVSHTYGQEPSSQLLERVLHQQNLNYVLEGWNKIKEITEDKTKRIGNQVINDKPAVGFSFDVPAKEAGLGDVESEKIPEKIWVGRDDGVPLLIELEFKTGQGSNVRIVISDIQWNVSIDERLFNFTVPVGWHLSRHLDNSIEFTGVGLRPSVSLQIGPEGQKLLATAGDVAGLVKTERSTDPNVDPSCTGLITIELTPAAAKRVHDYANAHPDKPIIVNFNGQIKAAAKLDAVHPEQVSFDITQLGFSMFKVEEKYATTIAAIENNKP